MFDDADYTSKAADRMPVSRGLVMCGGACVAWFSRTQKCVTLSTTQAEYVALADVMKEVLFLRQVWRFTLADVGMPCIYRSLRIMRVLCNSRRTPLPIATRSTSTGDTVSSGHYVVGGKDNIDHPRIIPFSTCGFVDQSSRSGLFRIPPQLCDEFVKISAVIFGFRVKFACFFQIGGRSLKTLSVRYRSW